MSSRSARRLAVLALVAPLSLGLFACGGDDSPTSATPPPPDLAGSYSLRWTLQVLRKSDAFQKEFACYGQMTLVQRAGTASVSALSGFSSVTSNCAPESYGLNGSVSSGGAIEFNTDGPRPPEGPCPGGKNVHFAGQLTPSNSDSSRPLLSLRGVTTVACPEYGEHEFTYLITAVKCERPPCPPVW